VKIVRKNAKPINATVGGMLCVDKALRMKPNTITIRVKDVIITNKLGN